jgi:lysophospholipase L1-like esterase/pimeloyl-ACP methyl ester carboxylesterase
MDSIIHMKVRTLADLSAPIPVHGVVPKEATVVFLCDSITDNGLYIAYLDDYFMHHHPESRLTFINLGISNETVSGLSEPPHPWPRPCLHSRLDRALQQSKPDWVVLAYGMNDGIYHPPDEIRFQKYQVGLRLAVDKIKNCGAKAIVLTPPPFDYLSKSAVEHTDGSFSWQHPYPQYNAVLKTYKEWVISLENQVDAVINIYDPLLKHIEQARQMNASYKYGDGIHPDGMGHWIIAKTVLGRLFNIHLERIPSHVTDANASERFTAVLTRHRLLSDAWQEHIGHTNPNRKHALPLSEAIPMGTDAAHAIRSLGRSNDGLYDLRTTEWKGCVRTDFYLQGREGLLISPKRSAPGKPWIWRTEFFDAFAQADMALVEMGYHLAYFRLSHMFGCPQAVELMESFRKNLVRQFDLSPKAALFGFSRGGLYAFHYAAAYPEGVACLYLDAPVLDVCSWPGGMGEGTGDRANWQACLAVYGWTEAEAEVYRHSLTDKVKAVAAASIPILIVAGDADEVVPMGENSSRLEKAVQPVWRQAGNDRQARRGASSAQLGGPAADR